MSDSSRSTGVTYAYAVIHIQAVQYMLNYDDLDIFREQYSNFSVNGATERHGCNRPLILRK